MTDEHHLTPAQRIGRAIGDLNFVMTSVNPQHSVYRVLKDVAAELASIKAALVDGEKR
jgi:hypothetical protein